MKKMGVLSDATFTRTTFARRFLSGATFTRTTFARKTEVVFSCRIFSRKTCHLGNYRSDQILLRANVVRAKTSGKMSSGQMSKNRTTSKRLSRCLLGSFRDTKVQNLGQFGYINSVLRTCSVYLGAILKFFGKIWVFSHTSYEL
jgi:hypothetical protein